MATYKKVVTESSSGNIAQNSATVTTNANLTGVVTSTGNATAIANGAIDYSKLNLEDSIVASDIPNGLLALGKLSAGGTASGTTFLRGDNTWATPTDISTVANLTDTTITGTPANNEVLAYDTTAGGWINQTHAEAGIQVEFAEGEISSNLIEQGAITLAQMANLSANTFIGRDTESTGAPEALSVSAVKTMLSLGNVTNTTDANKPVSTAQQTEIDTKAELAGSTTQDFSAKNLSVTGNLSITGTSEIRNTTTETINVADNTIVLNSDKSSTADVDAGIVVERGGDGNNKSIYWDEGTDKWRFGESASPVVAGTYQGDVASIDVNADYQSGSTVVPVGHFQYDTLSRTLYVRTT